MIKKINVVIAIVAMVLIMLVPARSSFAAEEEILTMEATQSNGTISVSGTTVDGILAVAINVYNEDGSTFIKMKTTEVNSDNKFSDSIEIPSGNYLVRVADYNGGNYKEQLLKVSSNESKGENESEESKESSVGSSINNSPKTGDVLAIYLTILVIATTTLIVVMKKRSSRDDESDRN